MQHPRLRFQHNPMLDVSLPFYMYKNRVHGGADLWKTRALVLHPELIRMDQVKQPRAFLRRYVERWYREHTEEVLDAQRHFAEVWHRRERYFFAWTAKYFSGHPWPEGKYIAYISMFDFGPRFLESMSLQVFAGASDDDTCFTIAHEMLHFLFYDYCMREYPERFTKLDPNNGKFWDLAEIFNAVVQRTAPFKKIHPGIRPTGYPAHKNVRTKLQRAWRGDVDTWIDRATKELGIK
ncbi:MAG: hypothetical protein ABIG71_01155 [Candidatus Uhrbacteria bacterium]